MRGYDMAIVEPRDIFAPSLYEAARRPVEEAETLPPWCYTSPAFHAWEIERVFRRTWLCLARADEIAEPGDYLACEVAGVRVLLVRGRDGRARAFANSCRHRGALLLEGSGNCRAIQCPYHSWTYALDGTLTGAPDMEETRGFEREGHGLLPIRLEDWEGFLFVNLGGDGGNLADHLGDCGHYHADYALADMVASRRTSFEVRCNWKSFLEVFNEYYHLKTVHPVTVGGNYDEPDPPDPVTGSYATQFGTHEGTGAVVMGQGTDTFATIPSLSGRATGGTRYTLVFPSLTFACTTDCMWLFVTDPLAPGRTRVEMVTCFPRETAARPDFDCIAASYYERWGLVMEEDIVILEQQQRALESPFARAGRLSYMEANVGAFGRWIAERVIGNG